MRTLTKTLLVAGAAMALAATGASAEVACNGEGECWHVKGHANYKPEFKLQVHPDSWKWGEKEHYKWRDHEGNGYWRGGVWIGL